MGILYIFLVLQSHHYIGVFRTASLTKRDREKKGQMSEKQKLYELVAVTFFWQIEIKLCMVKKKNFSSLQKRLIYIWFCDASELSFLWLVAQFVFLAFLRLGFDFILQLYVCICLVSFSAQVVFFLREAVVVCQFI